jgi:hypothetical protein
MSFADLGWLSPFVTVAISWLALSVITGVLIGHCSLGEE